MNEQGHTWQRRFEGRPEQARAVRAWVRNLLSDCMGNETVRAAELVASELFTAAGLDRDAADMTVSTAGSRIRVYATSPELLGVIDTHGPWRALVDGLTDTTGSDTHTLWAGLHDTPANGASPSPPPHRRHPCPSRP
ncbi:hypothetical protein [Embleya sp. NBC_00896]|uniref:hypothetical protein n=1 Tax=Embleya sp. NBC_00896 TaxID=2975961 RepID=UPI002F90EFFD|nr:hypothetical protein OG928_40300 [Embleya sp. NBC_00896]